MKRTILLFAMILLIPFGANVFAQTGFDLFVLGGYAHGKLDGGADKVLGNKSKDGFTAGTNLQLRLADTYGVAIGLRYTRAGGGGLIDSTFIIPHFYKEYRAIGETEITLDRLEVPLVFIFFIDVTPTSYIRAYLGPSLNFVVRAHANGVVDGKPVEQDLKDTMQSSHVSGLVGAGYVYEYKRLRFMLDAVYSQGLTKVTNDPDVKTRTYQIALGVGIPLSELPEE